MAKLKIKLNYMNLYMNLKSKYETLLNEHTNLKDEYTKLQKQNKILEKQLATTNVDVKKGKNSSLSGAKYEREVHSVLCKTKIKQTDLSFNTQTEKDLGGSSAKNDIECNYKDNKDVGIEVKKYSTPDWMQCSIKFDANSKQWYASKNGKIPKECRNEFDKLLNNLNADTSIKLFDGDVPPFMLNPITYSKWFDLKSKTTKWDDVYIPISDDIIQKLYRLKGCYYIQISQYGLYHLGDDICDFGVPQLKVQQQLRIRTKIHKRVNKSGNCDLSVTVACQPVDIQKLTKSPYSLDKAEMLPPTLVYNDIQLID